MVSFPPPVLPTTILTPTLATVLCVIPAVMSAQALLYVRLATSTLLYLCLTVSAIQADSPIQMLQIAPFVRDYALPAMMKTQITAILVYQIRLLQNNSQVLVIQTSAFSITRESVCHVTSPVSPVTVAVRMIAPIARLMRSLVAGFPIIAIVKWAFLAIQMQATVVLAQTPAKPVMAFRTLNVFPAKITPVFPSSTLTLVSAIYHTTPFLTRLTASHAIPHAPIAS